MIPYRGTDLSKASRQAQEAGMPSDELREIEPPKDPVSEMWLALSALRLEVDSEIADDLVRRFKLVLAIRPAATDPVDTTDRGRTHWDGWQPTAENINALPEALRQYVAGLETRCDPAGEVRELAIARDMIRSLRERIAELEAELVAGVDRRLADFRAIVRLQDTVAELEAEREGAEKRARIILDAKDDWRERAEAAEAERDRLQGLLKRAESELDILALLNSAVAERDRLRRTLKNVAWVLRGEYSRESWEQLARYVHSREER